MTKLFKNSKSVLSIALAFAVLAVSLFTGVVINTEAACASSEGRIDTLKYFTEAEAEAAGSSDRYYDTNLADNGETGDSWENAIIIDSALELSYLARYAGDATKGKYYKVADGIKGFDMSGGAANPAGQINLDGTLEENLDKITGSGKRHDGSEIYFQGNFDGNGATVYGLLPKYDEDNGPTPMAAGLFAYAKGNVTIKNVGVSLSYLKAKNYAGGIVGCYNREDVTDFSTFDNVNKLTIENCSVTECHIETTVTGNGAYGVSGSGAIYGCVRCSASDGSGNYYNGDILVNNCFINLDADHLVSKVVSGEKSISGGIGAVAVTTDAKFTNCVVLGINPYSSFNAGVQGNEIQHTGPAAKYTNIYTDVAVGSAVDVGFNNRPQDFTTCMTQLSADQMKGDAAIANMDLDWSAWLANPNGYPELAVMHKGATLTDNNNGTHSIACACGVYGAPTSHSFVDGDCECGAELNCLNKKTVHWDGTQDSDLTDGDANQTGADADHAIIIDSAEELAYLVQAPYTETEGKYYKVADDIGSIVLQKKADDKGIMQLSTQSEVEAYFENSANSKTQWVKSYDYNTYTAQAFYGTFDGNGATVYGLYASSGAYSLFGAVMAPAVIKNLAVKNSMMGGGNFGAIFASCVTLVAETSEEKEKNNCVTFENIEVSNCRMEVSNDGNMNVGILTGDHKAGANVTINNLLVYGCEIFNTTNSTVCTHLSGKTGWNNPATGIKNSVVLDCSITERLNETLADGTKIYNYVRSGQTVENVYSSYAADAENAAIYGKDITYITNEQATGAAAADLNLDWSAWMATADGYPVLRAAHDDVLSAEPYADDNYAGHIEACSCGVSSLMVKHSYDENSYCAACEFTCDHDGGEAHITATPVGGDCLTAASMLVECDCGFTATVPAGSAPGHDFTYNEEDPSDCLTQGTAAYNYCPNCDKKYAADADEYAPFEEALSDEGLKLDKLGDHTHAIDENDVPVYAVTDAGHQKICGVCSEAYGNVEVHVGEPVDNGDGTHSITCTVAGCGYAEASAPHNFGDDNVCDTCEYTCTAHDYVDGETTTLYWDCTEDVCQTVEQICSICGTYGEPRPIGHVEGDWQALPSWRDMNYVGTCEGEGQHTEIKYCSVCMYYEYGTQIVPDEYTGHVFTEYEEEAPTCTYTGTIAHKVCEVCWNCFAIDAADNEPSENALNPYDGSMDIPVDEENPAHVWVEYESTATCEDDGVTAHKFCADCYLFVVDGEETDVAIDWDAFWACDEETGEPIGIGAKLDSSYYQVQNEAFAAFVAENYPDEDIEVPALPEDTNDWDAMDAYNAEFYGIWDYLYTVDENWQTAWGKYSQAYSAQLWNDAYHEALLSAAEAAEVDMTAEATGHTLTKVDEVPATYEAEGTKAHYACDCGKLFSDAEGKNEATAESLVIAKLVKAEESKPSTDDKAEDDKTEGDKSNTSPATGESVATVAAVAALMGAAFVLVRKARKA